MQARELTALVERPRPSILAANVLGLSATIGLWAGSVAALALAPAAGVGQDIAVNALYYLPFVVIPIAAYMRQRRGLSEALRLNPMPVLPALTVMFLAVLTVFAATYVDAIWLRLLNALGLHEPETALAIDSSRALMLSITNTAAVPAVCEELLFRGFVLSAWESRGTRLAVWVSTALFALLHSNLFGMPAYVLVGAVSAYLVYALDSLYAGILYHTVYNAAILVIVYLTAGSEASTGVAPGMLSIFTELVMTLTLMALMLLSLDYRRRLSGIKPVPRMRHPLRRVERATLLALIVTMVLSTLLMFVLGGGA